MLRICEQPECFKDLEDGFTYFECHVDGDVYGYVAASMTVPTSLVHLNLLKWGHNILKRMIIDFDLFKRVIKESGITGIAITKEGNLESNASYIKFLGKLGFSEPSEILIANYEI